MNSKVGELEILDFDESGDLSPFQLGSKHGSKSSGSSSSKSDSEGEGEGEGEGEDAGDDGDDGDDGDSPVKMSRSFREDLMKWKKAKFRTGTLKRKSMVEPEEEDEEEDDDEAKAPEPVQKKKISAAEAQVTSMDFFPARAIHIFRFFCICYD